MAQSDDRFSVYSTREQLNEFLNSALWTDFCTVLEGRIGIVQRDINAGVPTMEKYAELRGELSGVQFWRRVPELIALEMNREKENDDATRE
jgi:hypothetical protein